MALYAFDGTWNFKDNKDALNRRSPTRYGGEDVSAGRDTDETNVSRFREFYGMDKTRYLQGVGTKFWWLGRFFGGAFGAGGKRRVRKMYRDLMKCYQEGDSGIDIVGFSRGAAMAVHFANVVHRRGIRNPNGRRHLAFWYYRDLGITFRFPKDRIPWNPENPEQPPPIDLLALWEVVATFGWPIGPLRNWSLTWDVKTVPANVGQCFHAMALDEVRATFELVRLEESRPHQVYAVWFRGVHANVGGGYIERGLSDIALAWMMEQAMWAWSRAEDRDPPARFVEALRMLEPEPGPRPVWTNTKLESLTPDPNGILGRPKDMRRQSARPLGANPLVHHSVRHRDHNLNSDHGASNRLLVRRIPNNARYVNDPPVSYAGTQGDELREAATSAFVRVTVNPRDWLQLDNDYVFRSDDWIGYGPASSRTNQNERNGAISRNDFLVIAEAWLRAGKPSDPNQVTVSLDDPLGTPPQPATEVKRWVVEVLSQLKPYLSADK